MTPPIKEDTLSIQGMTCASCVSRVEVALQRVPGVDFASVNLVTEEATVRFDGATATRPQLEAAVEAGRIPTDQGYRFFVDSLLQLKTPSAADQQLIESGLSSPLVEDRLQEAGRMLHHLSRHAGVVLIPRPSAGSLTRLEFVRLGDDRALAILVGAGGQVQNKLVLLDAPVTSEGLQHASNYLNELLKSASTVEELRSRILQELDSQRMQYDELAARALKLGAAATDVSSSERVVIKGTGSFFETKELADDVRRMRALFKALDDKHKLLSLLDRVQRAREMQIFIGAESEFGSQGDVTVIATPYGSGEQVLGTVGVIGPTRLDYQRVIPLVNFTAKVLSRVLKTE